MSDVNRALSEALDALRRDILAEVRVMLPATVDSYDHTQQRASVVPLLRRRLADGGGESLPVIPGVPVVFPRAGGASLTMPVNRGDGVMLVFCDRSMDRWKDRGGEVTPDDARKHALADAVALPGLYPFTDDSPQDNNVDTLLRYAGSSIRLRGNGDIEIRADGDVIVSGGLFQWEST